MTAVVKLSNTAPASVWMPLHDVEKLISSRNPKHLPLFVQSESARLSEIDVIGLPYISVFDKQDGERRIIPLVCGEGKILSIK